MLELIDYLNQIHPLSDLLNNYLLEVLKEKKYVRKSFLLKAGHVSSTISFVQSGLVRCFYEKDDQEVSSWFMKELDVIISVESFFKQTVSTESIQAVEDTKVLYIDYATLQYIYRNYPEFNVIGRLLTEHYYALSEQRVYSLRMQRADERYEYLIKNHPELILRVPSKYLASYLGVTEETLSRIRSKR